MKKILFFLLFFSFSNSVSAQLDVYLSSQDRPYGENIWTSDTYPHIDASQLKIVSYFHREDRPSDYSQTLQQIQDLIYGLFPTLTEIQKLKIYDDLLKFEKQKLAEYIAIALSPDTQTIISEKLANGFLLSPFETTFQACNISLANRRTIVRDLLTKISNGNYSDVNALQYSDERFGDCIIPFPDTRRGGTLIVDSFPSNKLAATSLSGSPLRFGTLEDSVDLFFLAEGTLDGAYLELQKEELLQLKSTRIETNISLDKKVGKEKILYIHQNHYINPFKDSLISGNNTAGYIVGGDVFNESNDFFIRDSDKEQKRILEGNGWAEQRNGIYTKTLIQENTFDIISGVFVPKQSVGATTYYAIIYNYDTTAPICEATLFSHNDIGEDTFIFPEYPWFRSSKYGYFVCMDDESGCLCDSSVSGCFIKDGRVLSTPQKIPHAGTFQALFWNQVELTRSCTSPVTPKLFYDTLAPNAGFTLSGITEASLIREYVSNNGLLYNGIDVKEKRFFNIINPLTFVADSGLDLKIRLIDPYDMSQTQEGVSGLSSYSLSISKLEGTNWMPKIEKNHTFENYNPLGTLTAEHSYLIDFQALEDIQGIITKVGEYQVYVDVLDAAGNQSRIMFYFEIIGGDIDISTSLLDTPERAKIYADNTTSYIYSLKLRDKYLNPIEGKKVSNISHTCISTPDCSELRLDMSGATPIGGQALSIQSIDTVSNSNGVMRFSVRSLVPGVFSESFLVSFIEPSISLRFSAEKNTFLNPFVGTLEIKQGAAWFSDILPVNQLREFRVRIEDTKSLGYAWMLSNFSTYLHGMHPDTGFTLSGPLNTLADGVYFSGTFTSTLSEEEKHKTLLEIVDTNVSGIIISYTLDGVHVRYRLSSHTTFPVVLELGNTGELQNPVKVIGSLQGIGNTHNTNEKQNFSDINSYELRNVLRKKVGESINSKISGETIGRVKYIDKTLDINKEYILESDPEFETLIVRNGNIHIRNNFNSSAKLVGLISYIDTGYNKNTGFEKIGNVYVEPGVTSINAIIYADGGFISTQLGIPVTGDTTSRNNILEKQLSFKGSLFTRNTLAGGRELDGKYILPGGESSTLESLARQYDLYYVRRGNKECIQDIYGFCNTPEYLIVEYDTRIMYTPPKFFEMK